MAISASIIKGKKISLKPIEEADIPTLWNLIYGEEKPEFKKWDAPYFPWKRVDFEPFESVMLERIEKGLDTQWLIMADGDIIGSVFYYWKYEPTNWMEIGITIYSPDHWNGGYGTEAIKLWTSHLFEKFPQIPRLGYTTWSGNMRMIQVGLKLGMQEEARIRKARFYNGEYYDSVKLGVLREEWEAMYGK